MKSSKPSVVLVGHGSKTRGFDRAMRQVASALRRTKNFSRVRCAFLDAAKPSIPEAIDKCVEEGATEVRVLPYFVLTGKHVLGDIPRIVNASARRHRDRARLVLCPYLGYHPQLVSIVRRRIREGSA